MHVQYVWGWGGGGVRFYYCMGAVIVNVTTVNTSAHWGSPCKSLLNILGVPVKRD